MHLDWTPIYGYFNSVCDCAVEKLKVPVYWPPIMYLDWRPIHGYFNSVCDCAVEKLKVPVGLYWPPIKVHYGISVNGLLILSEL